MSWTTRLKQRIRRELRWNSKEYGIITPFFMLLFRFLQFLPFQLFYGNKTDYFHKFLQGKTPGEKRTLARKRAIYIEIILIAFLIIELTVPYVYANYLQTRWFKIVCTVILTLRLIDIIQVNVNLLLFDIIRTTSTSLITKYTRAIILIIWNYFEIILIFGFYYLSNNHLLKGYSVWSDAYYFSGITQITIGYGDLSPSGYLRLATFCQGLIGTIFLVFIISRIISLIPELKEIDKD
ncbi:MAG: potassium channel family protein [Flavobacteriales bacterium]|nr:potassium channel family protein [Flavobacteriales bacterium]